MSNRFMQPDILIKIAFNMKEPAQSFIQTNATHEGLKEILEAWVQRQLGSGRDLSPPEVADVYHIDIGWAATDEGDDFGLSSDTGNKGLTAGIVLSVLNRLEELKVEGLPKREMTDECVPDTERSGSGSNPPPPESDSKELPCVRERQLDPPKDLSTISTLPCPRDSSASDLRNV